MSRVTQTAKSAAGRYRAISGLAVGSLALGVLSIVTALHWMLGIIPLAGIVLGWLGLREIRLAPEERTGRSVAIAGLSVSIGLWIFGCGWLMFARVSEVPFGYTRVTYEDLQPNPGEKIPESAYELQGKKVFVKGYMQPGRRQIRLKTFILCPAIPDCPFCTTDPKPTEMVEVTLVGDLMTRYTSRVIHVGGKLNIDPMALRGIPYQLEVDYLK